MSGELPPLPLPLSPCALAPNLHAHRRNSPCREETLKAYGLPEVPTAGTVAGVIALRSGEAVGDLQAGADASARLERLLQSKVQGCSTLEEEDGDEVFLLTQSILLGASDADDSGFLFLEKSSSALDSLDDHACAERPRFPTCATPPIA